MDVKNMTMQIHKISKFMIAAMLITILAVVTVTAADTASAACTKSYQIQLGLAKSGVTEKAVQIVYGFAPLPEGADGTLKGSITGTSGEKLSEFNLHDPRHQFGDEVRVSQDGKNVTRIRGIQQTADAADIIIMFPVTAEAKIFNLYDSQGTLLKSVDLSKAENKATWNCTPDYGITPPKESGTRPASSAVPIDLSTVVLALSTGAGGYLLMKRKLH
jgi:hypothetical protein